ncbi:hypothetical protein ACRRVB_02715 [Candidatus Cardinium hertigii]
MLDQPVGQKLLDQKVAQKWLTTLLTRILAFYMTKQQIMDCNDAGDYSNF